MKQIKFFVIIGCIATINAVTKWGDTLALFSTSNCEPEKDYLCENAKVNEERIRTAHTKGGYKFNFCSLNMKNNERIVIDTMLKVTIDRELNLTGQCIGKQTSTAAELKVSEKLLIFTYVSFELTRIIASMLLTMDILLVGITAQPMYPTPLLNQTTFIFSFEASYEAEVHRTGIMNIKNNYNMTYVGFLYLKEFDEDKQNFEKPCSDRKKSAFCFYANLDVKRHENCYKEILVDYKDPVSINNTMQLIWQDPNLRVIVLYGSGFSVHAFLSNSIVRPIFKKERIFMVPFERPLTSQIQLLSNLGSFPSRFGLDLLRNVPGEHSMGEFLNYFYYFDEHFYIDNQLFRALKNTAFFQDSADKYGSIFIPNYKKGDDVTHEQWKNVPLKSREFIKELFISKKDTLKNIIKFWKRANYKYLVTSERLLTLPWFNPKQAIEAKPFCNLKIPTCLPGQELTHGFYRDTHWQNSYGWNCQICPLNTFKDVKGNSKCEFCRYPRITNIERTQCYDPYENFYLRMNEYIIVVIISLMGIALMLIVAALFWMYRATPIVKHANRPITVLQLASHLALTVTSLYLFFEMPTKLKCTFRPLTVGIFFTLTVSINLGKTQKLLIIFNSKNRHTENERRFIGVLEWLITAFLVIVDVAIFIVSIVDHPPQVKHILNEDAGVYIRDITCSNNVHILIQLSFILILVLANGVQALRSRNLPSYFKETTHVIYSSFTSVVFLSAAVAIYAAQVQSQIRDIILYTCVMLLNLAHFLLLYTYKVYIILFKPELNTAAAFNAKRQKKLQKQFHQS